MNTLVHADIFFFITTIIVIVLAILVAVALFYVVRIARTVSALADKMKEEGELIVDDIRAVREKIEEEGLKAASFGKVIKGFFLGKSIFKAFAGGSSASKAKKAVKKKDDDGEFEVGEQF